MKVALVIDRFDPLLGGAEKWTVAFASYLLEQGHIVQPVTFHQANHDLPVRPLMPAYARSPLERARRIADCIAALRADVVHDGGTGWSGDVFHPHTGSRLLSHASMVATYSRLVRLRTRVSPRGQLFRRSMARLEAEQVARAQRIVAVSQRVRSLLVERHGVPDARITVVPNGVDTQRFAASRLAELRGPARRALDIGGSVLFLTIAHNMRLKGVDTAMRAIASLVRDGASVHLAVAGGAADYFWTGMAAKLGIEKHVRFLGSIAEIAPAFAAADAVIQATRWDACSLATIEGLAAGLPVVTTAMDGAAELIVHGRSGFVLPCPDDTDALVTTMRLLLDPIVRQRIGTAARDTARHHDSRDNFRMVENVLIEAAERRRAQ